MYYFKIRSMLCVQDIKVKTISHVFDVIDKCFLLLTLCEWLVWCNSNL
jgi:hypothetical protein